jgi:hypothetical protein
MTRQIETNQDKPRHRHSCFTYNLQPAKSKRKNGRKKIRRNKTEIKAVPGVKYPGTAA